jgi:hypothetical protein
MASITSIEKNLGTPVLHLQARLGTPAFIVTDQIYSERALNAFEWTNQNVK